MWQSKTVEEVLKELNTNFKTGLSYSEVKKRQKIYGTNNIEKTKEKSFFKKMLAQFSDFMVITLLIAALISFITSFIEKNNDYIDSIVILIIITINAAIGITQESNAQKAVESLKKISESLVKVLRDSQIKKIPSEEIVPGDILVLETGDRILGDARIVKSKNLKVEESMLSGESCSIEKNENNLCFEEKLLTSEISNMVFMSSFVVSGRALAVVCETGMKTQVGKIAKLIDNEKTPQTPLQKKITKTGKILSIWVLAICVVIFILGIFQNVNSLEMFMIAISLAVAAIPEGLPFVITLANASGVKRMAKHHAIVRQANAVETLASADIICTDKTGTLTQNKMSVTEIRNFNGEIKTDNLSNKKIISYAALCNNSWQKDFSIEGESTENALLKMAIDIGIRKDELEKKWPRIKEIPFDSTRKLMTTVHKNDKEFLIITKGAPEMLLPLCTNYLQNISEEKKYDKNFINKIKKSYEEMAANALRVLAIAYKKINKNEINEENLNIEKNLTFLGLIGISDPPRTQVLDAILSCKTAGIKPIMITGDNKLTAQAIARRVGISNKSESIITGTELNDFSQLELENKIFNYSVFARVMPEQKVRIVKAFQKRGSIVIMTGDGVNDAPALKAANIGCSMGLGGTDVAKAASDIVLIDDNFATIVEAIFQGRGIYDNIKKSIHFLISTNIGEIVVVLLGFLMRLPTPLLAMQLLWINLVTDSFPALALGMDPISKDVMSRKPVDINESLFSKGIGFNIIIEGCFMGTIAMIVFIIGRMYDINPNEPIVGRTMAFISLGLSQLAHAFNVKNKKSIFKMNLLENKALIIATVFCIFFQVIVTVFEPVRYLFKISNLNVLQWMIVIIFSFSSIVISEIEKYFYNSQKNTKNSKFSNSFFCR